MRLRILAFLVTIMSLFSALEALTRIVDINGTGQYSSIQAAINVSSPGDTVLVYPGRYIENVIIQTSSISLISQEALTNNPGYIDSTIIDGNQQSTSLRVTQNTQYVLVRGFSITNGKSTGGGGGLGLSTNSSSTIINCKIFGNKAKNGGGVIGLSCSVNLSGVEIYDNYAQSGGGLYINAYNPPTQFTFDMVNRCSIYNNKAGYAQDLFVHYYNSDLSVYLDLFSISIGSTYYAVFNNRPNQNFHLFLNVLQAHHQETNSDMYVSPDGSDANDGLSPGTALKTIHTAVYRIASDSLNQKSVYILPGTYSRTINQQSFPIAMKSWVKIKGSGIYNTQIIGEPDPAFTNQQLMVFASYYQNNISLEDMSITTVNSTNSCALYGYREDHVNLKYLRMYDLSPNDCAVIHITYAENCLWDGLILENITTQRMGYLACQGQFTGVIKNSVFRNALSTYISPDVWAYPLIWISAGAYLRIENTVFSSITMLDDDSQAIAFGSESVPNYTPHYEVSNCLFVNITCNERAVLLQGNNYPDIDITNCTFAGQNGNGEALMVNGIVNISNCIFYNNRSREIAINPMDTSGELTTITIDYSLIKDGYNGILQAPGSTINYLPTNINTNPLFAGGDLTNPLYYSLADNSLCINSGTPDTLGLNLHPYDLANNWRVWGGRIDMGCYEYGSEPWVDIDDPVMPSIPAITLTNYPNPFNPTTIIKYSLDEPGAVSLEIYNIKGQLVKTLIQGNADKGTHSVVWDGIDHIGNPCSSGVYFYKLRTNSRTLVRKMLMLK